MVFYIILFYFYCCFVDFKIRERTISYIVIIGTEQRDFATKIDIYFIESTFNADERLLT